MDRIKEQHTDAARAIGLDSVRFSLVARASTGAGQGRASHRLIVASSITPRGSLGVPPTALVIGGVGKFNSQEDRRDVFHHR